MVTRPGDCAFCLLGGRQTLAVTMATGTACCEACLREHFSAARLAREQQPRRM